jgi:hypothetical protein
VFLNRPTLVENARLRALLQVSIGDANLGCFDSKYHFNAWRPRTAIPAADADGNADTIADTAWTPLVGSQNHRDYPSGHSCIAGAVGEVVKRYYGTPRVAFSWNSTITGTTHPYDSMQEMVREIKNARLYGGRTSATRTTTAPRSVPAPRCGS